MIRTLQSTRLGKKERPAEPIAGNLRIIDRQEHSNELSQKKLTVKSVNSKAGWYQHYQLAGKPTTLTRNLFSLIPTPRKRLDGKKKFVYSLTNIDLLLNSS